MAKYVSVEHLIEYLKGARQSRTVNISPYMDNALLNVIQLLELDQHSPVLFDFVEIGDCEDCEWKNNRHQKCSCCRRNRHMADLYKRKERKMSVVCSCGCYIEAEMFTDGFAICPMCEREVEYNA